MLAPADFSGAAALERLARIAGQAAALPDGERDAADPLGLCEALRAVAPDHALAVPGTAITLGSGRPGAPILVCAALRHPLAPPGTPGESAWGVNADGSGPALLLTLAEALEAQPPAQPTLLALLPEPAEASVAALLLAAPGTPAGVVTLGALARDGITLDMDPRCFLHPPSMALLGEIARLGRTLGNAAFTGGAEYPYPGLHEAFLEREVATVALCEAKAPGLRTQQDTLAPCSAAALQGVGDTLCRYLRGERAV